MYNRIDAPLWFHIHNLNQTASGYGSKLTTRYKIQNYKGRDRRLYVVCYSNVASFYVMIKGKKEFIPDSEIS